MARLKARNQKKLSVFFGEFFHEGDEGFDAVDRHGIVDGSAHTADETMAFKVDEAGFGSFFDEFVVDFFFFSNGGFIGGTGGIFSQEGDVHERAATLVDSCMIEIGVVEEVVKEVGFFDVAFFH